MRWTIVLAVFLPGCCCTLPATPPSASPPVGSPNNEQPAFPTSVDGESDSASNAVKDATTVDELCRRIRVDRSSFREQNRGRLFVVRGEVMEVVDEETQQAEDAQSQKVLGLDESSGELHPIDKAYYDHMKKLGIDPSRSTVTLGGNNPKWLVVCGFVSPTPPEELTIGRQVVIEGKLETALGGLQTLAVQLANSKVVETVDSPHHQRSDESRIPGDLPARDDFVGTWRAEHQLSSGDYWLAYVFEGDGRWTLKSNIVEEGKQPTGQWELVQLPNGTAIAYFRSDDGNTSGRAAIVEKEKLVVSYLGGRQEEYRRDEPK